MENTEAASANNICSRCNSDKTLGGKVLKPGECNVCVVVDDMWEAVGGVLVKHFPEAVHGDVSPLVSIAVDQAHESLAKEWIPANVPNAEHENA